jgi:hypothetical protein
VAASSAWPGEADAASGPGAQDADRAEARKRREPELDQRRGEGGLDL